MKVYIDEKDIGTTITYKEENGKKEYIYCHDREGFVFKDLADYTKQVRKEVVQEIKQAIKEKLVYPDNRVDCPFDDGLAYEDTICDVIDQIQGETECQKN